MEYKNATTMTDDEPLMEYRDAATMTDDGTELQEFQLPTQSSRKSFKVTCIALNGRDMEVPTGYYHGAAASNAARRAASALVKRMNINMDELTIVVGIRAVKTKKEYMYEVTRVCLEEPKVIMMGETEVTIRYDTKVRSMNK